MYTPLTEETALAYFLSRSEWQSFFARGAILACRDLADGNVNLVFRIYDLADSSRSVILKQALPHARRYPDFKMPLERARIEVTALRFYESCAPGVAVRVFGEDSEMFVTVMEDLSTHRVMREGMITQVAYPNFAPTMGQFIARATFLSSDFALSSAEKKERVRQFLNPVLCKVTEDLVFTFPYEEHPSNRYPNGIEKEVRQLQQDPVIAKRANWARRRFMAHSEALVHGDLHTGSIMVNQNETRVIDPEFAFYGPMGFDVGMLIANLAIAFHAQEFHASDAVRRRNFQVWLTNAAQQTWDSFREEFVRCADDHALSEWRTTYFSEVLAEIETEALAFCACEMLRRTIGMAHVPELDTVTDVGALTSISDRIVRSGALLLGGSFSSFKEFVGSWEA